MRPERGHRVVQIVRRAGSEHLDAGQLLALRHVSLLRGSRLALLVLKLLSAIRRIRLIALSDPRRESPQSLASFSRPGAVPSLAPAPSGAGAMPPWTARVMQRCGGPIEGGGSVLN